MGHVFSCKKNDFSGPPRFFPVDQWEFQDPKMEVLYHIRPYFGGDIPLHRPYIGYCIW